VEAEINQVVKEACPTAGAPFLGSCKQVPPLPPLPTPLHRPSCSRKAHTLTRGARAQGDCTWLVWRDMGELTLEHFLIAASSPGGSLAPLANALLVPDFKVFDSLKTL